MQRGLLCLLVVVSVSVAHLAPTGADEKAAGTEEVGIPTPRGVELVGVLHRPAAFNGVAVVIGSGRGYHKDLPLLVRTAEELQKKGFIALRFDWAYFTAKGKHAPDLSTELEDLEAAMSYARGLDGVKKLYLAGKSLGSVAAAMRANKKTDDIDGLILLTFPIHSPGKPDGEVFDETKKIAKYPKPVMLVIGDADPYSELAALYRYAAGFEHGAPRLVIVPGDHGLQGPEKNEDRTAENCDLAARGVALWASRWAAKE